MHSTGDVFSIHVKTQFSWYGVEIWKELVAHVKFHLLVDSHLGCHCFFICFVHVHILHSLIIMLVYV